MSEAHLPDWKSQDGFLIKNFKFEDFDKAFAFADKIRELANELEHHPDLEIGWGKVVVKTTTHDAGGKVTEKDYQLAEKIDSID